MLAKKLILIPLLLALSVPSFGESINIPVTPEPKEIFIFDDDHDIVEKDGSYIMYAHGKVKNNLPYSVRKVDILVKVFNDQRRVIYKIRRPVEAEMLPGDVSEFKIQTTFNSATPPGDSYFDLYYNSSAHIKR